ncbi:hypothetical protein B0H13DRAFT_1859689 [Mycena leptocephala]|nr:hypothetical protein B0H13DRAFT_1859689 [Mycena leptocephala]
MSSKDCTVTLPVQQIPVHPKHVHSSDVGNAGLALCLAARTCDAASDCITLQASQFNSSGSKTFPDGHHASLSNSATSTMHAPQPRATRIPTFLQRTPKFGAVGDGRPGLEARSPVRRLLRTLGLDSPEPEILRTPNLVTSEPFQEYNPAVQHPRFPSPSPRKWRLPSPQGVVPSPSYKYYAPWQSESWDQGSVEDIAALSAYHPHCYAPCDPAFHHCQMPIYPSEWPNVIWGPYEGLSPSYSVMPQAPVFNIDESYDPNTTPDRVLGEEKDMGPLSAYDPQCPPVPEFWQMMQAQSNLPRTATMPIPSPQSGAGDIMASFDSDWMPLAASAYQSWRCIT